MGLVVKTAYGQTSLFLPHAGGRYYSAPLGAGTTTLLLVVNTLYAIPFFVSKSQAYSSINIEVTTASAGNNLRMGIYSDSSGVPGALVADCGTVSLTGTGAKSLTASPLPVTLAAGWYWLALVANGAATVRAITQTGGMAWLGFTSGTDVTTHLGWSVAFTYAALPNPFTGGGALMTTAVPRLMLGA